MPTVGERKRPNMGNFSKDPMYKYAAAFCDVQNNILRESQVDYSFEPIRASKFKGAVSALREFYTENSVIGDKNHIGAEEYQDQLDMMNEAFTNDLQAVQENAAAGMNTYNPIIGLSLPMHKYLMMNCVFAQALPRFVAKCPAWTETMETRYMVTPEGKKIDIANQQNEIFGAWKSANMPVEVPIKLPEAETVDILDQYFKVSRVSHNLSTATHISAVLVDEFIKEGMEYVDLEGDITVPKKADADGVHPVWKPVKLEFTPGYGELNRNIIQPVDFIVSTSETETQPFHDTIFATQKDNMFSIQSTGKVKAVKMLARYDASSRMLKTNKVSWEERSKFVSIPESDGITVPVTPEEVKDIGALYGINQVTKYMSIIKDIFENVKDDDIKQTLDESYVRLDDDHKLAKTIDFAPPMNYLNGYKQWINETFMDQLDEVVTGLLTILRDPNMRVCVIGRPSIIRKVTPIEYSYTTPQNVGPVELDFKKTVVTSDKREYNFISSDKLWGNDNLIILLIPKNSNRIVYRLYDYQMYISNEIRDAENPALPAITAFQRYLTFEFQPLQGRVLIANSSGLRTHLPNIDPIGPQYTNNDLGSVFKHYDETTGKNVTTENKLP